jgi:hypothetical protein
MKTVCLGILLFVGTSASSQYTEHGVVIPLVGDDGASLAIEVGSMQTFRFGVRFGGDNTPLPSPSLDAFRQKAAFKHVSFSGGFQGIQTTFGALVANDAGQWRLLDALNNTVLSDNGRPVLQNPDEGTGIIQLPVTETDRNGPEQQCLGNGHFGPPFYWGQKSGFFSFVVSAWDYDPENIHCYPASFGKALPGPTPPPTPPPPKAPTPPPTPKAFDTCSASLRHKDTDVGRCRHVNEQGGTFKNMTVDSCCAKCNSLADCTSFIFCRCAYNV